LLTGLQLTVGDVWKLFLGVSLHDVPVHFCVGMEMFNGGIKKLHIITYFLILGIITPIGIIIGIVVTEHAGEGGDGTQTLVIGVLQGLAGGTLLYITFYEVLDREKLAKAGMTGILGCFLLTCGFAFMAGMEAAGTYSKQIHNTGIL
jgi:zinc transporter 1/2/3